VIFFAIPRAGRRLGFVIPIFGYQAEAQCDRDQAYCACTTDEDAATHGAVKVCSASWLPGA
jgi:hypothetical protein